MLHRCNVYPRSTHYSHSRPNSINIWHSLWGSIIFTVSGIKSIVSVLFLFAFFFVWVSVVSEWKSICEMHFSVKNSYDRCRLDVFVLSDHFVLVCHLSDVSVLSVLVFPWQLHFYLLPTTTTVKLIVFSYMHSINQWQGFEKFQDACSIFLFKTFILLSRHN